jgi:hypothetical protein
MALFGFKRKKDEVLNHWIGFADGFTIRPQEFYDALERELDKRKLPGLQLSLEEYPEGGLLSENRLYMRMIRERLAFDICAAPFGVGSFFSCRTVYSPVVVRFWHILVVLLIFSALDHLLWKPLGPTYASIAIVGLIVALVQTFRNTVALGLSDLDNAILKTPAIGPIYERWIRKETYYRYDARLMYLHTVSALVKELAEEVTAEKGIKLITQFERAPIFGDLYKPVKPSPEDAIPK